MKSLVINAVVTALALLAGLAAGEALVRVLFKDTSVLYPRYHTDYHYGGYALRGTRPNAEFWHTSIDGSWKFVTNSRGFRNTREFAYAKPAGTLRVLVLGDSQTLGYEVRQQATFAAALERHLARTGIAAEVLNTGVSGFSTAEELAFLENEGYRYHPDVVVVGFYANDFDDNLKAGLFELDAQGHLAELKYEHLPGVKIQNLIYSLAPVRWLSENSYFYSLLFNGVWEHFKASLTRSATAAEYAVAKNSGPSDHELRLATALLERMHAFCESRGMRLIVVDIPRQSARYRFAESWPPPPPAGLEFVSSRLLLERFEGVAELHVSHGHHHISEFTHALIARELGRRIGEPARAVPLAAQSN
jgi:hypothetical protein